MVAMAFLVSRLLGANESREVTVPCPCKCTGKTVNCRYHGLVYIPDAPADTEKFLLSGNKIRYIPTAAFEKYKHLFWLDLSDNHLRYILRGAFDNMRSLTNLYLNNASLDADYLRNMTSSLVWPNLKVLGLRGNHLQFLPEDIFYPLNTTNLMRLDLSKNGIKYLPETFFKPLHNLRQLYFHTNELQPKTLAFKYLYKLELLNLEENLMTRPPDHLFMLTSLQILYLRGNQFCRFLAKKPAFLGLRNLKSLYMDANSLGPKCFKPNTFSGLENLQKLSMAGNFFSYCTKRVEKAFSLFTNLKHFELSSNHFRDLPDCMLKSMKSLEYFGAEWNGMCYLSLRSNTSLSNDFQYEYLKTLKHLKLGHNAFTYIDSNGIEGLENLEHLELQSNKIERWKGINLPVLKHLELQNNQIPVVEPKDFAGFPKLETLGLAGNPFSCGCRLLSFRQWIRKTTAVDPRKLYCAMPEKYRGVPIMQFMLTRDDCTTPTYILQTGVASFFIVCVLVILATSVYRYQWHLKELFFRLRKVFHWNGQPLLERGPFLYDAVVCYSNDDACWVFDTLLPNLENVRGFRLCIRDRNTLFGDWISEAILETIEHSRKAIVILSKSFVRSQWGRYELFMAHHKLFEEERDILVFAMLEDISMDDMPETLRRLLTTKVLAQWTDDPVGQELFWATLTDRLTSPGELEHI